MENINNNDTYQLLVTNNVSQIKNLFSNTYMVVDKVSLSSKVYLSNNDGDILLKLVSENSNDFTKDIAQKSYLNEWNLSDKQAWCVAYQIHNNIEIYKLAFVTFFNAVEALDVDQNESVENNTNENVKYVVTFNNEGFNDVQEEFTDLQTAFAAFSKVNLSALEDGQEYELVKYDQDNQAIDWSDAELNAINWPLNTWVTRSKTTSKTHTNI